MISFHSNLQQAMAWPIYTRLAAVAAWWCLTRGCWSSRTFPEGSCCSTKNGCTHRWSLIRICRLWLSRWSSGQAWASWVFHSCYSSPWYCFLCTWQRAWIKHLWRHSIWRGIHHLKPGWGVCSWQGRDGILTPLARRMSHFRSYDYNWGVGLAWNYNCHMTFIGLGFQLLSWNYHNCLLSSHHLQSCYDNCHHHHHHHHYWVSICCCRWFLLG